MSLANYTDLQAALLTWSERSDLTSYTADFVQLSESRLRKAFAKQDIRLREMETTTTLTPSSGAVTIPSDYLAMKRVQAVTSPIRRLEYKTSDWLDEAYPDSAEGDPSFYTVIGSSLYMFPLTTSDIKITYYAFPAALSSSSTNWLLTKYPDTYLFAGLVELATFAQDEEGVPRWAALLAAAMEQLGAAFKDQAITSGTTRTANGPAP